MQCQKCNSERLFVAEGAGKDCNYVKNLQTKEEFQGYTPRGMNILPRDGDVDVIQVIFCGDCGQMQGEWPIKEDTWKAIVQSERNPYNGRR